MMAANPNGGSIFEFRRPPQGRARRISKQTSLRARGVPRKTLRTSLRGQYRHLLLPGEQLDSGCDWRPAIGLAPCAGITMLLRE